MTVFIAAPTTPERIYATDGTGLSLRFVGAPKGPAVVLCHGTFSNHRSFLGLANHLASRGFACWLPEWRGHGDSERKDFSHNLDDVAERDVPVIIQAVLQRSGQSKLFWVGHSAGGLLASMWAARHPLHARQYLRGLVMFGSQATDAGKALHHRFFIYGYDWMLRFRRMAPRRRNNDGPEAESARVMRQWFAWNLNRRFHSREGFDYLSGLNGLGLPVFGLAGGGDQLIAPLEGVQALVNAFTSSDAQVLLCGKSTGYREDYNHRRLLVSRNSSLEIWPQVGDWLAQR